MTFIRFLRFIILSASLCFVGYQPALGQGNGIGNGDPFADINAQLDALAADIQILQNDAHLPPNPRVEGRQYCRTLSITSLVGDPIRQTRERSVRQLVSFGIEGVEDSVVLDVLSSIEGRLHHENFSVSFFDFGSSVGGATYTQIGTELIINFNETGNVRSFHVSGDGSLIYGGRVVDTAVFGPSDVALILESVFVEIDSTTGAECAVDLEPIP